MPLSPAPRRTLFFGTLLLLPLLGLMLMSAFAAAAGLPYPASISLDQAMIAAWNTPWPSAMGDVGAVYIVWVAPGTLIAWSLYAVLRRRRLARRVVPAALFALSILPATPCAMAGPFFAPTIPGMLAGGVDGEFYAEGWGCIASLGGVMCLFMAIAAVDAMRAPAPPGHCPRCQYDRRDLPLDSACPECGTDQPPVWPPVPVPVRPAAPRDNPYSNTL